MGRLFFQGKPHQKGHLSIPAAYLDPPMVGQDNGLGNGKAQPIMGLLPGPRRIQAVKALKELRPLLLRDLRPVVADGQQGSMTMELQGKGYLLPGAAVLQRIVQ